MDFSFDTINNIKSAFSPKRHALSKQYYALLTVVLNQLHKTHYSQRFWTFLLRGYVGSVVSNLEIYGGETFQIKLTNNHVNKFGEFTLTKQLKNIFVQKVKHLKSYQNKNKISNIIKKHNSLHIGFPLLHEVDEDLGQRLPIYYPDYHFRKNPNLRSKLKRLALSFDDTVIRNMVEAIPKIFVEGFSSIISSIPLHNPEKKIFHFHIEGNYISFLLAKYTEYGAKLYWYQHGAYYGELENGAHVIERELADVYRTWGWKIDRKDEPWKAYRLMKFAEIYGKVNTNPLYDIMLCLPNMPSFLKDQYEVSLNTFIANLNPRRYKKILVRFRPAGNLNNNKFALKVHDNRVTVSNLLQSMVQDMSSSSLSVQFRVPSTNFLECIYLNYPTIALLRNDQPTNIIKPHYENLLEAKVLHEDLNSMLEMLNNCKVEEWWQEVIKSDAYISFKNSFCRS